MFLFTHIWMVLSALKTSHYMCVGNHIRFKMQVVSAALVAAGVSTTVQAFIGTR